MSHFAVLVVGDNAQEQLAPYYEHLKVPRYVKYSKQELIAHEKKNREQYKQTLYKKFLANPDQYKKDNPYPEHLQYIENTFSKILQYSDEELYQHALQYIPSELISKKGAIYSSRNPKAKRDYCELGGRWEGHLVLKK